MATSLLCEQRSQLRANHIPQRHHSATDARFDRAERRIEMFSDFRLRHRRKERELECLALVLRELLNGIPHQFAGLHRRDRVERTSFPIPTSSD